MEAARTKHNQAEQRRRESTRQLYLNLQRDLTHYNGQNSLAPRSSILERAERETVESKNNIEMSRQNIAALTAAIAKQEKECQDLMRQATRREEEILAQFQQEQARAPVDGAAGL